MTQPNQTSAAAPPAPVGATAAYPGDEPVEPDPSGASAQLGVDVVMDDEGAWSAFGDAQAAVLAAAGAVAARAELALGFAEATIALSSDAEVATLNAAFRGKPVPTNVLSFPAAPSPAGVPLPEGRRPLGDIILARETILAEAALEGIPPVHHLQHLVVHGLLHLLGFDHGTGSDAAIMEALETSILAGLDIPDPYAEHDGGEA